MPEPISIYTISTIAFLITLFHRNFFTGTTAAYLVHVIWVAFTYTFYTIPLFEVMVYWFFASFVGAFVAWVFATLWKAPLLLNGQYLWRIYKETARGDGIGNVPSGLAITVAKIVFVLAWLALSHIWFELDVSWLPGVLGGVITLIFITVGYIVFYFLFRDSTEIFKSSNPHGEVWTLAFYTWLFHAVYTVTYFLCDYFVANFITDGWYFYVPLIVFGVFLVLMVIFNYTVLKDDTSGYKRTGV